MALRHTDCVVPFRGMRPAIEIGASEWIRTTTGYALNVFPLPVGIRGHSTPAESNGLTFGWARTSVRIPEIRHHAASGRARLEQSGAPRENRTHCLHITNVTFSRVNLQGKSIDYYYLVMD